MQADQINCLKPLEIWDFGLALASRQRLPVLKRTKWCVFFVEFPCPVGFCVGWRTHVGRAVFILTNTNFRPMTPKL